MQILKPARLAGAVVSIASLPLVANAQSQPSTSPPPGSPPAATQPAPSPAPQTAARPSTETKTPATRPADKSATAPKRQSDDRSCRLLL